MASAADNRRYETQKHQREAVKAGMAHPRGLARSVAKAYNRAHGHKESEIGKIWRGLAAKLPRKGRKYLRTEAERMAKRGGRVLKGV